MFACARLSMSGACACARVCTCEVCRFALDGRGKAKRCDGLFGFLSISLAQVGIGGDADMAHLHARLSYLESSARV